MKLISEGNGLWAIAMTDGSRPVQHESYQVCSNIAEMAVNGLPDECDECDYELALFHIRFERQID